MEMWQVSCIALHVSSPVTNKRNSVKFRSNWAPDFIRKLLFRISNGGLYILPASHRGFS